MTHNSLPKDPRWFQITALTTLLFFGLTQRAFEIPLINFTAIMVTACAVQWLASTMIASKTDLKSPLITALSLTLLLRAETVWPLMAATAIAIGSKFILRIGGKHIFNPANIGIVVMVLFTDLTWTTPGQWGSTTWLAAVMAAGGFYVAYRAARIDVPLIFLGTFAALIFARALWLGDPLSIPLLRLENGALVLFAFFMISDPKTTPDGTVARAVFSASVAALAYILSYHYFITNGLFYALAILCIVRPVMEFFNPATRYRWGDAPTRFHPIHPSFTIQATNQGEHP